MDQQIHPTLVWENSAKRKHFSNCFVASQNFFALEYILELLSNLCLSQQVISSCVT